MKQMMQGNEAIARGAWEAGVTVGCAYPGTPSSEIMAELSKYREIYTEWTRIEGTFVQNVPGHLQCCSNLASIMLSTPCTNVPLTVPLTKETNHSAGMNRLQDGSLIVRRKK